MDRHCGGGGFHGETAIDLRQTAGVRFSAGRGWRATSEVGTEESKSSKEFLFEATSESDRVEVLALGAGLAVFLDLLALEAPLERATSVDVSAGRP